MIAKPSSDVDARFDPGLERRDGAACCRKMLSELDLERGDLLPRERYSREDVTRQETQSKLVRVVDHDRVVDRQVQRNGK